MSLENPKCVVFGTGVIGGSVGAWVAPRHDDFYFVDRPPMSTELKDKGLTVYPQARPEVRSNVPVQMFEDLKEIGDDVDFILLAVKNYSLETVAKVIQSQVGDGPTIVAMQNGVDNQQILPKYFSKVIYCIVSYNAWMDDPGVIGYQKQGPLYLGTLDNDLGAECQAIKRILDRGVETHVITDINDAAHCKLVINLTNSLTTLLGLGVREINNRRLFQTLLTGMLWEGVQIIKAAGYKESKLGGMPPWAKLWVGSHLPQLITRPIFEKGVQKMVMSSMAQDVFQRGGAQSELDSLNGYLLGLADTHGVNAPINRKIFELCKREFARPEFTPMSAEDVWAYVRG